MERTESSIPFQNTRPAGGLFGEAAAAPPRPGHAWPRAASAAGAIVALLGSSVAICWMLGIEPWQSLLPGSPTMKFNTAVCFVLAGVSLFLAQRPHRQRLALRTGALSAWAVLLISTLTLLEYVSGWNLLIDELAVSDLGTVDPAHWPGRMSIGTAVSFAGSAAALLLLDIHFKSVWQPAQLLAALVAVVGGAALLGYAYGVETFRVIIFSTMGVHTAFLFLVLTFGILIARPHLGLTAVVASPRMGGRMARHLLPALFLILTVIGWLCLQGVASVHYSPEFGFALSTIANMVVLSVLICAGARSLNAMHEQIERMHQARAFLASIVESSDDAIVSKDLGGVVTSWNPGAERIYGYSAAEMLGEPMARLLPQDRLDEEHQILNKICRGERVDYIETTRRRKSGDLIDMSITISPIMDDLGKVIGASSVGRDITERKRDERRFRAVVEATRSGVIMVDTEDRVVLTNTQAESMFGYPRGRLLGQTLEVLVPHSARHSKPSLRADYLHQPESRLDWAGQELHGQRQDGSTFPVEISLTPIETAEGPLVLAAVLDITERKHAEADLRSRTEELARSNQELEQFAYIASHDLQEPLRAIAGCVQLLKRRYHRQLDERADELIDHAVDGATRMQALINDLLSYSRVGRKDDPPQATSCTQMLQLALKNLSIAIEEVGAEIKADELPTVLAVSTELALLFQNLVANAIKFRREDVRLHIEVGAQNRGDEWLLWVKDNGIGIEPQYFDRIFKIFQRLHTRREFPGSGIGLALCKRIVELHGGRIWVDSIIGSGTTIYFTLHGTELTTQ